MRRFAVAALAMALGAAASAAVKQPFSSRFEVELINDSIWWHCELRASVEEKGKGVEEISCKSDEDKLLFDDRLSLAPDDVNRLRQLLRNADVFQGQFWGMDLRGLDASFVTLAVHDEDKAAVIVCVRNESFETGSRKQLLEWLLGRIDARRREHFPR